MKQICCLCEKNNADTVEHVPPKCIFLGKYRGGLPNLITVPACKKCNNAYKKDDEYFRDFLAFQAYKYSEKAKELWDNKTIKAINKLQAQGYNKSTLKRMQEYEVMSSGGIYLGNVGTIIFEINRLEVVIRKIVRGMYFHVTQSILPQDVRFKIEVKQYNSDIIKHRNETIEDNFVSIRENIFKYCVEFNQNRAQLFLWLVFFDSIDIWTWAKLVPSTTPATSDTHPHQ